MIRKYGELYESDRYMTRMIERMRKWGFNSGGAFTGGGDQARQAAKFAGVEHLPLNLERLPGIALCRLMGKYVDVMSLKVATQQERGLAYRNYVEQSAATGVVIGIEWFTLTDQAVTGRYFQGYDGERANTGVIGVTDRPWKPALAEMMKTNYDICKVWFGERPPFVWDDPRFKVRASYA